MKNLKLFLLTATIIFTSASLYSQAVMTQTEINKEKHDAVMLQINHPESLTEDVLQLRFKNKGLSGSSKRGVTTYTEVMLPDVSPDKANIYTKVEKVTNNSSIIYITVSKADKSFIKPETDKQIFENLKNFLNPLISEADKYSADADITNKMKDLDKEKKKYDNMLDDKKDLEKQKDKLEKRLQELSKDIDVKKTDIYNLENILNDMKAKRQKMN
jgi:hypothetical protein